MGLFDALTSPCRADASNSGDVAPLSNVRTPRPAAVAVPHVPTIEPLDVETALAEAREGRPVATIENRSVVGGLGGVLATPTHAEARAPFRMIGLPDEFLEVGALPEPCETCGLSVGRVAERIEGRPRAGRRTGEWKAWAYWRTGSRS